MSMILLTVVFSVILNERKKEFGILRVLGASKKKLSSIIIYESLYIGIYGSLLGVILGTVSIFSIFSIIHNKLSIPFLMPSWSVLFVIYALSIMIGTAIGCISSFNAIRKISKSDAYLTVVEN